jgi:hypothetical protein
MTAYYNEIDPFAAAWLRKLIEDGLTASGDVGERSIKEAPVNKKKLNALEYAANLEERLIAYDAGNNYWVYRDTTCYTVQRPDPKSSASNLTASDSSYPKNEDGLSIAIARCNYLARSNQGGKQVVQDKSLSRPAGSIGGARNVRPGDQKPGYLSKELNLSKRVS